MISNTERKITYPISLLLSINGRKSCESLGKQIRKSGDTMLRLLNEPLVSTEELIKIAQTIFKGGRIFLIVDDTLIAKIFSTLIEGVGDNFDSADKTTYKSLCSVVAMLTDGKIAIPITQAFWTSKELNPTNYKTKTELAQDLTLEIYELIDISMVIADGLYATQLMMQWLIDKKILFEMRFHSNRVVEINGSNKSLKDILN